MGIGIFEKVVTQPLFFPLLFMTSGFSLTFILQSQLLYKCATNKKLSERLSANILVNIVAWIGTSFFGFVYVGYLIIRIGVNKNTQILFWSGTLCSAFGLTVSGTITFLMIDRVFVLIFPIKYNKTRGLYVLITILICSGIWIFSMTNFIIIEFPLRDETTDCNAVICLLKKGSGINTANLKLAIGIVNIFTSIVFCIILKKYSSNDLSSRNQFKKANLLIGIAVISEFVCNLVPLAIIILSTKLAIPMNFTTWPTILITVDGCLTAIIYKRIIKVRRKNSQIIFLSTGSPNTHL